PRRAIQTSRDSGPVSPWLCQFFRPEPRPWSVVITNVVRPRYWSAPPKTSCQRSPSMVMRTTFSVRTAGAPRARPAARVATATNAGRKSTRAAKIARGPPRPSRSRSPHVWRRGYSDSRRLGMALTHVEVRIANPARPRRFLRVKFLVDSGAIYSVVPRRTLVKLGVKPHSQRTFILADGSKVTRRMGDAVFALDGRRGASPVIFGEE